MPSKIEHLQIRVTPQQKGRLKRLAAATGQDVSSYVLSRALPLPQGRFEELVALLGDDEDHRYVLAELNELLTGLGAAELESAVVHADLARLSPFLQNYLAAMVEQACYLRAAQPPAWVAWVVPLDVPHFAVPLKSLRMYLLRASPVPFKRRNIFVDATVGARV